MKDLHIFITEFLSLTGRGRAEPSGDSRTIKNEESVFILR
jgi:hypothetical protein